MVDRRFHRLQCHFCGRLFEEDYETKNKINQQFYFAAACPSQAFRRVLPPLTGQAVSLVKDSALVSTIAIYDLTMQAQAVIAETFLTFELWFTVAGMYLIVTVILSIIVSIMENRFKVAT